MEKLIQKLQLGTLLAPPSLLNGGLSHTTYFISTGQGDFVLKHLNPVIMRRSEAPENYRNSEALAHVLSDELPVVSALSIAGDVLIEFEKDFYMLFPFIPGRVLNAHEITEEHCAQIGRILATIHARKIRLPDRITPSACPLYPWVNYPSLANYVAELERCNLRANRAIGQLNDNLVMSHRDLDPKNVLWQNNQLYLIDWESAGMINPVLELWEACLNWGDDSTGKISSGRVMALLDSYIKVQDIHNVDWEIVSSAGYAGMLGWLDYNAQRMSSMELSLEEIQLGKTQVEKTLQELALYEQRRTQIVKIITNVSHVL